MGVGGFTLCPSIVLTHQVFEIGIQIPGMTRENLRMVNAKLSNTCTFAFQNAKKYSNTIQDVSIYKSCKMQH